jgi:uncharacterized iron-regulated membrane protein
MKLRSVLFWLHLLAGTIAGIVILTMSVTGALLTFQQSVLAIVERSQRVVVAPPGAARLDLDALTARVREAIPDAQIATIALDSDPSASAAVAIGGQRSVFVNPYTGDVLGTGSARARAFYRNVTNVHRWLAVEGEHRATARAITGACNAAFLVLAITGLYLWWPRQWKLTHVSAVVWFRRGLRGKPRDFNWHNAIGLWSAPILIVLTASGMVISYPWASNLVYTLTGSPRPVVQGQGRAAPAVVERSAETIALAPLQARAGQRLPTWRAMIVRLPARAGGPVSFSMSDREHWNSFARSTLTLDAATGSEIRWEPYDRSSLGQKVRGWLRFAHTGELGGLPGEALAGLACIGGAFLVWTGIALAIRRFSWWLSRVRSRSGRGGRRKPDDTQETPAARVA